MLGLLGARLRAATVTGAAPPSLANLGRFPRQQRFETGMNQRRFFPNPGEFPGSLDQLVIYVQRGTHMHQYA